MKNIKTILFFTFIVFMFAFTTGQIDGHQLCDPDYGEIDTESA
ncbi:hypothetical protein [Oceanobacillus limi]|nr:hypothetical protein [Oceanobacillus limi]